MEIEKLSEEQYMENEKEWKEKQSISRTESAHLFYELMKGHKYEEAWDDDEFRKLYKLFEEDDDPDKVNEEDES